MQMEMVQMMSGIQIYVVNTPYNVLKLMLEYFVNAFYNILLEHTSIYLDNKNI